MCYYYCWPHLHMQVAVQGNIWRSTAWRCIICILWWSLHLSHSPCSDQWPCCKCFFKAIFLLNNFFFISLTIWPSDDRTLIALIHISLAGPLIPLLKLLKMTDSLLRISKRKISISEFIYFFSLLDAMFSFTNDTQTLDKWGRIHRLTVWLGYCSNLQFSWTHAHLGTGGIH